MASIKLKGDTSGELTISAPAVAGTNTLTLPVNTGTLATINLAQAFTETQTFKAVKETKVAMAADNIDLSLGAIFTKTITTATTLTVSNVATTGLVSSFILDITNGGAFTVTWFAGVTWAAATAPVLTAAGRDSIGFFTYDGGTTWTGVVIGLGIA